MYYTMSDLSKTNIDECECVTESYKTMKVTWENMEKMCRDYTDKIDVETSIKKVIDLETEYLMKLNDFYNLIENDSLSILDRVMKKYIPTVILVLSSTLACLGLSNLEVEDDVYAKKIMGGAGMIGAGAGIVLKVKNSSSVNFKQNALEAINIAKDKLKQSIAINQKYLSVGIKTTAQAAQCTVKVDKEGKIEVYRKYE